MNIVLGASGQVGSAITDFLIEKKVPVRAVIRDAEKAEKLKKKGIEVAIADYFDVEKLEKAVEGGELIFLLTPETGMSDDVLGDTKRILENYRKAIENSGIKSIIGLSSVGAQYEKNTGNLLMSNMLEHEFVNLQINQVFVRPSYYFSNWMMSVDLAKEHGILPTFFPPDLKIYMNSPIDVAEFIGNKISNGISKTELIELVGPQKYSPNDIAREMAKALGREVKAQEVPREKWEETMKGVGFSDDAVKNFVEMTQLVADGKAVPEGKEQKPVVLKTTFEDYLKEIIT